MKILLTGGGTGGHFYPIIAVAQHLQDVAHAQKITDLELYYMSDTPYNAKLLEENNLIFIKNTAGKRRRYFSLLNYLDIFKIIWGSLQATWKLFTVYPDVVFGKGGYASFPTLFAARILRIPVIIHESDTVPGRVNKWAGKFAKRIATGFPETAEHFPTEKTAYVGNLVRKELTEPRTEGAREHFQLTENIPVIFAIGGSQGSEVINDNLMDALPQLVEDYYVIHQTGEKNTAAVAEMSRFTLSDSPHKDRYHMFPYLDTKSMQYIAGLASIVISRAGASTTGEIAAWGTPSILIPITDTNGDHQRQNAFSYARLGACSVIEEKNLTRNIIVSEVRRILNDRTLHTSMSEAAKKFYKPDAAEKIASEIIEIALTHKSQ